MPKVKMALFLEPETVRMLKIKAAEQRCAGVSELVERLLAASVEEDRLREAHCG